DVMRGDLGDAVGAHPLPVGAARQDLAGQQAVRPPAGDGHDATLARGHRAERLQRSDLHLEAAGSFGTKVDGVGPVLAGDAHAGAQPCSTPRRICSSSIDSNKALKLPSPKPWLPLRW